VPVVEVVPALPARLGEGRGFVVRVAGGGQPGLDGFLHVGAQVVVGQFRRLRAAKRVFGSSVS
jgi:hypothetical protein